ncbi:MAG: hypothetical protein IKE53_06215 [Clostridiales bacterium]|nr:hypothetical protein [Clostridiales bacterium]
MRLRLNGIFKDNMVFQWGTEIRFFGQAEEACYVCVQMLDGETIVDEVQSPTDDDLGFMAVLQPTQAPGGPYEFRVFSYSDEDGEWTAEAEIYDCYAGEVWLASGQSNMEYPLIRSEYSRFTIERVPRTQIHYYQVPQAGFLDEKQADAEASSEWTVIDSDTCRDMSAIAFYFARELESRIDCKIGIIGCFLGGTSITCWMSEENLMSSPEGRKAKERADRELSFLSPEEYVEAEKEYEERVAEFNEKQAALLREDPYITYLTEEEKIGPGPWPPPAGPGTVRHPGAMYECMVRRVAPFMLRGVIFYQGETDCDEYASGYGRLFTDLISEWREAFLDLDLPFIFCQLPMYISKERKFMDYDDYSWAILRQQQQMVADSVPNVYMAVLSDCGEFNNIHPADKKTPGHRLAGLALKFIYEFRGVPAIAPYIIDARRGDGVEVSFAGDFIMLNLLTGYDSDETGFEVAGEDGEFYKAGASVDFDGKTVILNCPKVEFPMKVRYAYFSYGPTPLYAENGLAATPFSVNIEKDLGGK